MFAVLGGIVGRRQRPRSGICRLPLVRTPFCRRTFRDGHRNRAARARMTVETETQATETETHQIDPELVSSLLTDESFRPAEPTTLEDTGLSETLVESLICKRLAVCGSASGREVAKDICLPFTLVAEILATLRSRK